MEKIIQKGFYYHFKHKPEDSINNFAYEMIGIAKHSESGELLVVYRPLYTNEWKGSADFMLRPYDMFTDEISRDEFTGPRFRLIDDHDILDRLQQIKEEMYGNN